MNKKLKFNLGIWFLLALTLFNFSCSTTEELVEPVGEDNLLPSGMPESVGLITSYLEEASSLIASAEDHKLHSMLLVRDGILVFEEYYNGYSRVNPRDIRSATKSITSLLTGIALD